VKVSTRIAGYKKIKFYTLENLGYGKIELPDLQFHTTSYWITFVKGLLDPLSYSRSDVVDGVLGLGYALHSMAALHLMSDPHDLCRCVGDRGAKWFLRLTRDSKGIYSSFDRQEEISLEAMDLFEPTLFLYDNYPGGMGFSHQLFDDTRMLLERTLKLVSQCKCQYGCPSCVGPSKEMGERSKEVAVTLLREISK
jgi:DEAD/DEAH box helicase domain-containing protein